MNKLTDGTQYEKTYAGYTLHRGKRTLFFAGVYSVNDEAKAKELIATKSFNELFSKAKQYPGLNHNVRYIAFN